MQTLAFPLSSLRSVELDEAGLTIGPLEQHATCSTVCAKLSAPIISHFYTSWKTPPLTFAKPTEFLISG